MSNLTEAWAVGYLQVLVGLLVLVFGLPALIAQQALPELRPLVQATMRPDRMSRPVVWVFVLLGLTLIWFHPASGQNPSRGTLWAEVIHFSMFIVFLIAGLLFAKYVSAVDPGELKNHLFGACSPPRGLDQHKAFERDYETRLGRLRNLGELSQSGEEKSDFLNRLGGLIGQWDLTDLETTRSLRPFVLPRLLEVISATVINGSVLGNGKNFILALQFFDAFYSKERERQGSSGNTQIAREQLRLVAYRLVELAALGREPDLKDALEICLERFRDFEAELFQLGERCLELPLSWGTLPALLRLRACHRKLVEVCNNENSSPKERQDAADRLPEARAFLLGLAAEVSLSGRSVRDVVETQIFTKLGVKEEDLEEARRLNIALGNFAAADALFEVIRTRSGKSDSSPSSCPSPIQVRVDRPALLRVELSRNS